MNKIETDYDVTSESKRKRKNTLISAGGGVKEPISGEKKYIRGYKTK